MQCRLLCSESSESSRRGASSSEFSKKFKKTQNAAHIPIRRPRIVRHSLSRRLGGRRGIDSEAVHDQLEGAPAVDSQLGPGGSRLVLEDKSRRGRRQKVRLDCYYANF